VHLAGPLAVLAFSPRKCIIFSETTGISSSSLLLFDIEYMRKQKYFRRDVRLRFLSEDAGINSAEYIAVR